MRTLAWLIPAIVCVAALRPSDSQAAQPAGQSAWNTKVSDNQCTVNGSLLDASGTAGAKLEIRWTRGNGHWLEISLSQSVPVAPWVLEITGEGAARRLLSSGSRLRYHLTRLDNGEQFVRELSAGRTLSLTVGFDASARRYSSANSGTPASMKAFDECIARLRSLPEPEKPPPRWAATVTGRSCSVHSNLPGVPASIAFHAGAKLPLHFSVYPQGFDEANGGVLQIDLPGAKPWLIDTERTSSAPDPRDAQLLDTLLKLKPVAMAFTRRGAAPARFQAPLGNIEVAGPMFKACMTAAQAPGLPPQLSLTELNYTVTEAVDACELSGSFQIQGNALWLVLVTDGTKNVLKVTRRMVKPGQRIESLDLSALGGPKVFTAEDTVLDLEAGAFSDLRKVLAAHGGDFTMRMSRSESYVGQFGGKFAPLEAPMFNACVEAKFPAAARTAGAALN